MHKARVEDHDFHLLTMSEQQLIELEHGLHRAQRHLADWSEPPARWRLANALIDFAEMLGVSEPGEGGISLFLAALTGLPDKLLDTAKIRVAQTHRFARLPLPADFLRAVEGERAFLASVSTQLQLLLNTVTTARNRRTATARRNPD